MNIDEIKLKKREQNLNFWKFFLGTFILGLAAAISSYILKSGELKLEATEAERNNHKEFVDRFMNYPDEANRRTFVLYMSLISSDENTRNRYDVLYQYLDSMVNIQEKADKRIDSLRNENPTLFKKFDQVSKALETGKSQTGQDLSDDEKKEMKKEYIQLKAEDPIQRAIVEQETAAEVSKKSLLVPLHDLKLQDVNRIAESAFPNTWLKEGYYNPYGEYYLAVMELDSKNQEVTFQLRRSERANQEVIGKNFTLRPGSKYAVSDPATGKTIAIELTKIAGAGRNILTKAAYFDMSIYAD